MPEQYPSDAELAALSGSADPQQEVLYVAAGESPYHVSFYKMLYRLLDVARRGGDLRAYKDGDLTFGVRAGRFAAAGKVLAFAGATGQGLTNNQTNYIYLTAAGTLAVNTTGFPDARTTPHLRLACIVTAAGAYSHDDITDLRGSGLFTAGADLPLAGDSYVFATRGASDAESGDNLLAAYAAAKLLTPGGSALGATNRAVLLLPPGGYLLYPGQTDPAFLLDASFVDVVGLGAAPADAVVYAPSDPGAPGPLVRQTADDVRLANFSIRRVPTSDGHTFQVNANDNSTSRYLRMEFTSGFSGSSACPVHGASHLAGTWEFCRAGNYAWRLAANKNLSATMRFCVAGTNSFGGDATGAAITGALYGCIGGASSFGGCATYGCNISGTLTDCEAGGNSFAMGKVFSGNAYRCRGGNHCFGGYSGGGVNYGTFSGYAEDCIAGGNSFGSGHASCVNSGELVRCRNLTLAEAMYLTGAKLRGCEFKQAGANKHCLALNDGNSKIFDCTLIANGAGNSIYAGAAKNVLALHCRMNADKHANVTNLVGDGSLAAGYCVVDGDVNL